VYLNRGQSCLLDWNPEKGENLNTEEEESWEGSYYSYDRDSEW
jgi:hypothetical protein